MKRCVFAVVALFLASVSLKSQGTDVALYTVENLGTFGGQVPSITGVNASGQVSVGRSIPNHALYHYLTECAACLRVTHSSCERLRNQSITIFAAFVGF